MADSDLKNAIEKIIREKGGDLVRKELEKSGNQEAIDAFNSIGEALTDFVVQWLDERLKNKRRNLVRWRTAQGSRTRGKSVGCVL